MMRRDLAAAAGAVALVALLAGCTPADPEPTTSATPYVEPAIVGDTVSDSPLESDEWVIAARAGMLGYVLANNVADFSIEPFTSTFTEEAAQDWFSHWSTRSVGPDRAPLMWPGPQILLPLSIDPIEGDDTRVQVRFCDGSDYWEAEDPAELIDGVESAVWLVRTESGILVELGSTSVFPCDATGAAIGRFDPAPEPLGPLTDADVVPPPSAE